MGSGGSEWDQVGVRLTNENNVQATKEALHTRRLTEHLVNLSQGSTANLHDDRRLLAQVADRRGGQGRPALTMDISSMMI
jgi:hypothetical protein